MFIAVGAHAGAYSKLPLALRAGIVDLSGKLVREIDVANRGWVII